MSMVSSLLRLAGLCDRELLSARIRLRPFDPDDDAFEFGSGGGRRLAFVVVNVIKVDLDSSSAFPSYSFCDRRATYLALSHASVTSSSTLFRLHIPSDAGSLQLGQTLFESSHERMH